MPSWSEIISSAYGAWRLARFDANGMAYFKLSVEGFWHSFFAAVLLTPAYVLLVLMRTAGLNMDSAEPVSIAKDPSLAFEAFTYLSGWIIWPITMLFVARLFGQIQNYAAYIIVYNWGNVIQISLLLPVAMITHSGILPEGVSAVLSIVITLFIFFYLWFLTRTALRVREWAAASIVTIDVLLGMTVSGLSQQLFT